MQIKCVNIAIILVFVLLLSGLAACSAPDAPKVSNNSGYAIDIYLNDLQLGSVNLHDLQGLKQVSFDASGKTETGPTLSSVLGLETINKFNSVTVYGVSAQLTLQKVQVNNNVILGITDQGKVDLAELDTPSNTWIAGVTKIVITQ